MFLSGIQTIGGKPPYKPPGKAKTKEKRIKTH